MTITNARFYVGQIIIHKLFNYRGVIIDADPDFQGSEEWYNKMAKTRPAKDRPWYHVLVDDANHQTYVAEQNLQADDCMEPIEHPMVELVFSNFQDGVYQQQKHNH